MKAKVRLRKKTTPTKSCSRRGAGQGRPQFVPEAAPEAAKKPAQEAVRAVPVVEEPDKVLRPVTAQTGAGAKLADKSMPNQYESFALRLEDRQLQDLKHLFGCAAAYEVVARCSDLLSRFRKGNQSLPGSSPCGLVSLSMTLTGLQNTDDVQAVYEKHVVSTGQVTKQKHRESICLWTMMLPFERQVC